MHIEDNTHSLSLPPSIHILHARLEIRNINLITILKVAHSIAGGAGVRISWCCFLVVMGNGLATWTEWTRQFRDCKVTGKFTKENTKKEISRAEHEVNTRITREWTGKGKQIQSSRLAISKWTHCVGRMVKLGISSQRLHILAILTLQIYDPNLGLLNVETNIVRSVSCSFETSLSLLKTSLFPLQSLHCIDLWLPKLMSLAVYKSRNSKYYGLHMCGSWPL